MLYRQLFVFPLSLVLSTVERFTLSSAKVTNLFSSSIVCFAPQVGPKMCFTKSIFKIRFAIFLFHHEYNVFEFGPFFLKTSVPENTGH